jgi:hypothetical protein
MRSDSVILDRQNRHPADVLADVRAEIKRLQAREHELREILLMPNADLAGDEYSAAVREYKTRQALGYHQLVERLGLELANECSRQVERIAVYLHKRAHNGERSGTAMRSPHHDGSAP